MTEREIASINGEIFDLHQAKIPVLDHCFLYGDGVFEGVRLINGGLLFHKEHLNRLYNSAEITRLQMPEKDKFEKEIFAAVKASGMQNGYLRIVISRGTGSLGINPKKCPTPTSVIIVSSLSIFPEEVYQKGLKLIVAKTRKIPLSTFDCRAKSCNYLSNIMAVWECIDQQADEAIMLTQQDFVSEGSVENIFALIGKRLITPSTATNCLEGITRARIIEIARAQNLQVEEGLFTVHDFQLADEVFLTGTGAGVVPVSQIERTKIGTGQIGEKTKRIREKYESTLGEFFTYP